MNAKPLVPRTRVIHRIVAAARRTTVAFLAVLVWSPINARADVVLDWDVIAVNTLISQSQNPFAQARYMAITQLAVFEAVNAITGDYEPYIGTVVAPAGASVETAAIAAAYRVLKTYFPGAATLDTDYAASLASIPDGSAKTAGIVTGEVAAAQMIALRVGRRFVTPGVLPARSRPIPACGRPRRVVLPQVESVSSGKTSRRSGSRASLATKDFGSTRLCLVHRRRSPAPDMQRTTKR